MLNYYYYTECSNVFGFCDYHLFIALCNFYKFKKAPVLRLTVTLYITPRRPVNKRWRYIDGRLYIKTSSIADD
jgi:hypothetical protein